MRSFNSPRVFGFFFKFTKKSLKSDICERAVQTKRKKIEKFYALYPFFLTNAALSQGESPLCLRHYITPPLAEHHLHRRCNITVPSALHHSAFGGTSLAPQVQHLFGSAETSLSRGNRLAVRHYKNNKNSVKTFDEGFCLIGFHIEYRG